MNKFNRSLLVMVLSLFPSAAAVADHFDQDFGNPNRDFSGGSYNSDDLQRRLDEINRRSQEYNSNPFLPTQPISVQPVLHQTHRLTVIFKFQRAIKLVSADRIICAASVNDFRAILAKSLRHSFSMVVSGRKASARLYPSQ